MSQFRQNLITKEWVLIAPNRGKRPEDFAGKPIMRNLSEIDPECVFCPGNETRNAEILKSPDSKNWEVRVIPNKYEAIGKIPLSFNKDFYSSRSGSGDHEVVITRKHNEPIALQSVQSVELSLQVLRSRLTELGKDKSLAHAQVFHNHGRDAGASLVHPHYQIMTTPFVPSGIQNEISGAYDYYRHNQTCVYCAIIREEKEVKERMIHETDEFLIIVPYASTFPFETWILPKKHMARFEEISAEQIRELAYVLKVSLGQLYIKLSDPALNFFIQNMPFKHNKAVNMDERAHHWYIKILPRLTIWAAEYATDIPINPVVPEHAAEFLR
jgi:UDPglucose--hexose-1-phosphate uridylyltransferase